MVYLWLIILIGVVVVEAITPTLVSIWFIPGAVLAGVFALVGLPEWLQITVFIVLSLVLLVTTKSLVRKIRAKHPIEKSGADALIGKDALVVEDIDNIREKGAVKIDGKVWSARAKDDETVVTGDIVKIEKIDGVKLIVYKNIK